MKTQEQLDAELGRWHEMVNAALDIRRRIVAEGRMATKSAVEDVLMPVFEIDRYTAHQVMNHIEYHNLR